MSWIHPTSFVTLVLVALSLSCYSSGQNVMAAAKQRPFPQGEKESSLISSASASTINKEVLVMDPMLARSPVAAEAAAASQYVHYGDFGVPIYASRRRRGQDVPGPEDNMDILRQILMTPYYADGAPEILNPNDYVPAEINSLRRRPRHGQLHDNLTRRQKKALSVLSRCCPFWTSSSSSAATSDGDDDASSGGTQAGSGGQTTRSLAPLGGRRHYLQDYDSPSEFLRTAFYAGHSIRPYSMRLRWGK